MDPMNIYGDIFAEVYNLFWTEFIDIVAPQIISIYKELDKSNNYILDLACGTGRVSKLLLDEGYFLHGIDLSPDMINIAKRKAEQEIADGRAVFEVGNIIDFTVDRKFGLAISTFDSLNHLGNYDELRSCFDHVYQALDSDGLFIFDLNTARGLKKWEFVDFEENEEATFIMHGKYSRTDRRAYTKVIGFKKMENGFYQKFDEIMYNTVFEIEQVISILREVGFRQIITTAELDLTQVVTDPEKQDRTFIICQKME